MNEKYSITGQLAVWQVRAASALPMVGDEVKIVVPIEAIQQ